MVALLLFILAGGFTAVNTSKFLTIVNNHDLYAYVLYSFFTYKIHITILYLIGFFRISSGTCESNGLAMINGKAQCEAAASYLDLPETSAVDFQSTKRPYGCVYIGLNVNELQWNSPIKHYYLKDYPLCGYKDEWMEHDCICQTGKIQPSVL